MRKFLPKRTVAFDYHQEEEIRLVLEIVYLNEKEHSFDQIFFSSDDAVSYLQFLFLNFEHRFRKQLVSYDPFIVATSFFYNILLYCSFNQVQVVTDDVVKRMLPNWVLVPLDIRYAILHQFQKEYSTFSKEKPNLSSDSPKIYSFPTRNNAF